MTAKTLNGIELDEDIGKPDTEHLPFNQFLTYRIAKVHAKLSTQTVRLLKKHAGINLAQWRILVLIGSDQARTHSDIVRGAGMDKGLASRTIKSLRKQGFIEIVGDERDSRLQPLKLLEKGTAIYNKMLPKMRKRQARLNKTMSEDEREFFMDILNRLELLAEDLA